MECFYLKGIGVVMDVLEGKFTLDEAVAVCVKPGTLFPHIHAIVESVNILTDAHPFYTKIQYKLKTFHPPQQDQQIDTRKLEMYTKQLVPSKWLVQLDSQGVLEIYTDEGEE